MSYITDEVLALNGMVITVTYNDGSTTTVPFTSGTAMGYTASPANGDTLTNIGNNGHPVTIMDTGSGEEATTGNLTVNP
jgi:hypothetical protein